MEIDLNFLTAFLNLIVLGICLCVGFIIKTVFKNKKLNQFIPLIMAVLGVILALWISGWTFTPQVLLVGLFSGLASTGLYELFKNFISGNKDK